MNTRIVKIVLLMVVCISASERSFGSVNWSRQNIAGLCSFSFPGQLQVSAIQDLKNYALLTDTCSYLVQIKPMTRQGVVNDSASLSTFYGGVVNGILRASHGTLIGQKPVSADGLQAVEVEYIKGNENHQPVSICSRVLLLNGQLIIYSFSSPYATFMALRNNKDHFLNSFSKDSTARSVDQFRAAPITNNTPGNDMASKQTGGVMTSKSDSIAQRSTIIHTELVRPNTLHFIISFIVCILLLAGLLYVVVRWRKQS